MQYISIMSMSLGFMAYFSVYFFFLIFFIDT